MTNAAPPTNLQRLEALEKLVADQAARLEKLEAVLAAIGAVFTGGGADVAEDDELDSKFGNEAVKRDPTQTYWKGPSYVGNRLSECPPEYLDALARYKDVCAKLKEKDGTAAKKKYAEYDRKDAARARGWARRLRSGWTPPEPPKLNGTNGGPPFGGGSGFGGGSPFGGGSGFGTSRSRFGAPSGGFGMSRAPAPAPPPPFDPEPPQAPSGATKPGSDDDDFPFGANAEPKPEPTNDADDDDDDLSLNLPAT